MVTLCVLSFTNYSATLWQLLPLSFHTIESLATAAKSNLAISNLWGLWRVQHCTRWRPPVGMLIFKRQNGVQQCRNHTLYSYPGINSYSNSYYCPLTTVNLYTTMLVNPGIVPLIAILNHDCSSTTTNHYEASWLATRNHYEVHDQSGKEFTIST